MTQARTAPTVAVAVALVGIALAGCAEQSAQGPPGEDSDLQGQVDQLEQQVQELQQENRELQDRVDTLEDELPPETGLDVVVKQDPGNTVYWVLPGERRLSPMVFGTPDDRRTTGAWSRQAARDLADAGKAPPSVPGLLEDLPILTGVPEDDPEWPIEVRNGTMVLTRPTLFSDDARIVDGSFRTVYRDRQPWDTPGPPGDTKDSAELEATFTDPAGHRYEVTLDHLVKPPIPGYETGGGVITNAWHHGAQGPGSPLMPRVYSYGAFWGLGNLSVDGEQVDTLKLVHVMTTQMVRTADYELAIDEDLPLPLDDTPTGQAHHTHLVVFPIGVVGDPPGPKHQPVNTSFVLPNNRTQPFIHVMYEEDVVVEGPFETRADGAGGGDGGAGDGDAADLTITAHDDSTPWEFTPPSFTATAGEEVTVKFVNDGKNGHNWGVDLDGDGELSASERTSTIGQGASETLTFTAPSQTGDYAFWCDITGHRQAGLEGTMTVEAA